MSKSKYQNIADFVHRPFRKSADASKDLTYAKKYSEYVRENKIEVRAMTVIGDSYYYHLKIPSESQKDQNYKYDVVIRFFTDDPIQLNQPNLNEYYLQFFSNSPSFIYQYAYVYKKEGYLIEDLFDKLDGEYENIPPKKTNPNGVVSYDKSIYFATRFLFEKRFRYLVKRGPILLKQVKPEKFFSDISDFNSVKFDQSLIAEERKLQKELEKDSNASVKTGFIKSKQKAGLVTTNTRQGSITVVKKKGGGAHIIRKKKAKTTTRR